MADPYAGMNPDFAAKVRAVVAASGGQITIKSGHRSTARQSALWNAALAKYGSAAKARKWVAPPGKSNHEHGTAVDFGGPGGSKLGPKQIALLKQLAPRFGLHQALANEPWHYEPIGSRGGKQKAPVGHSADDGHGHAAGAATAPTAPDPVEAERFTWEYQLRSLGDLLMSGGGEPDGELADA